MTLCKILAELLAEKNFEGAKAALNYARPSAIVECLRDMPPNEQALLFRLLEKQRALDVFERLDRWEQTQLVRAMEDPDLVQLMEAIEPDARVRLLEELPAKVVKRILLELSGETLASISVLLGYPEDSAGRVMNPKYLALPEQTPVSVALQQVRQSALDPDHLEVVFVLGEGRLYKGYVTLAKLLKAAPDTPLC
ncbi:MAG: CBS domain-containing protein, partial [Fimbriimonadales bacterium]|nr:CBS domain-containing protein [Fimbriimonadales bacterium]